jgi:F0F1-type ATP synthase membrane subunit b/b'
VTDVLHQVLVAFEEILAEMGLEVVENPVRMIAEIVQFVLLIGIVWVVAVGFGKRRGFVANLLSERYERIERDVERASHADENLSLAQANVRERSDTVAAEASRILAVGQADAERIESTACAEADAESSRILDRAKSALATETEEMHLELREELVTIVAQATRSILNEKMTVSEQRELIENSIVASLAAPDTPPAGKDPVPRKRVRAASRSGTPS